MLPPITIVCTTYFPAGMGGLHRQDIARETIRSWWTYLKYDGELRLHIADDGSPYEQLNAYRYWYHNYPTYSRQTRHGVGASLNTGFQKAFETSPLVAYFVDDWALTQKFDLTPWAQALMEREDIGMIRLGPPHPSNKGTVEALTTNWQGWAMILERYGFAFGHRPALYHKRMIDWYGWFQEDCNALECERLYAVNFNTMRGPSIALALPHPWQHTDSVELAYMEPRDD